MADGFVNFPSFLISSVAGAAVVVCLFIWIIITISNVLNVDFIQKKEKSKSKKFLKFSFYG